MDCPKELSGPLFNNIFLGCSVVNWSLSAGLNNDTTSMTVELVQDPCSGTKVWWDSSLNRYTGYIKDPGFMYPQPGCAVYFRVEENISGINEQDRGGFEFCGLVQDWTEKKDTNGNPTYTVTLTDPTALLDATNVIIGHTDDGTSGLWNLLNVYGIVQSLGTGCSGSLTKFGGVTKDNVSGYIPNDNGMVWNDIKCAIHTLTSSIQREHSGVQRFCRDGRIVYTGPSPQQEGMGVLKADAFLSDFSPVDYPNIQPYAHHYLVDLTEIPFGSVQYRINGPVLTLTELINKVCTDAGCDYYKELLPIKAGNDVLKFIKIRTISRTAQSNVTDAVTDFIQRRVAKYPEQNGGIVSYTRGKEERNEPRSIYLLGGKKRIPYVATGTGQIYPYWGLNHDGTITEAKISGTEYLIRLDLFPLQNTLYFPFTGLNDNKAWVSEAEIRAAIYDFDSWKFITHLKNLDIGKHLTYIKHPDFFHPSGMVSGLDANNTNANPFQLHKFNINIEYSDQDITDVKRIDAETIYNYIKEFGNTYYGRQYLVNVTGICYTFDRSVNRYVYSYLPSMDGCWVNDTGQYLLGITNNNPLSFYLRDNVGKYGAFAGFEYYVSGLHDTGNFSINRQYNKLNLDEEKFDVHSVVKSGYRYLVKTDVLPGIVHGIPEDTGRDITSVVLKFETPTIHTSGVKKSGTHIPDDLMVIEEFDIPDDMKISFPSDYRLGMIRRAILPTGVVVPLVSNIDRYGPWGFRGVPGHAAADIREELVPWNYGSEQLLDIAARTIAEDSVSQLQNVERGSLTLAGIPRTSILSELLSIDSDSLPITYINQQYVLTRTYKTASCIKDFIYLYVPMLQWTGSYGPNITNMSVDFGPQGFTTTYQFNTYTPQYGKISKKINRELQAAQKARTDIYNTLKNKAEFQLDLLFHRIEEQDLLRKSVRGYMDTLDVIRHNDNINNIELSSYKSSNITDFDYIGTLDELFVPTTVTLNNPSTSTTPNYAYKVLAPASGKLPIKATRQDYSTGVAVNTIGYDSMQYHIYSGSASFSTQLRISKDAYLRGYGFDIFGNLVGDYTKPHTWPVGPIDWDGHKAGRFTQEGRSATGITKSGSIAFYFMTGIPAYSHRAIYKSVDPPFKSIYGSGEISKDGFFYQTLSNGDIEILISPNKAYVEPGHRLLFDSAIVDTQIDTNEVRIDLEPYNHHIWEDSGIMYPHKTRTGVVDVSFFYLGSYLTGVRPTRYAELYYSPVGFGGGKYTTSGNNVRMYLTGVAVFNVP